MGEGATVGDKQVTLEGLGFTKGRARLAAGRKDGSKAGLRGEGSRPVGRSWRGTACGIVTRGA